MCTADISPGRSERPGQLFQNNSGPSWSSSAEYPEKAPVAILVFRGPEFVVDLANQVILEISGKGEKIIGRPLLEAMPELRGASSRIAFQYLSQRDFFGWQRSTGPHDA
jgi:hypothetical protein